MPGRITTLIGTIKRKPTNAPDRKSDSQANGAPANGEKTSLGHDLTHMKFKDARVLGQGLTSLASGEPLDDKELLLEHGVSMLQGLPLNSGLSASVSDAFIKMLYHDLPHPPATLAGPTSRYRRHDGGGNVPWNPEMGKAGSPYSRSVPPMKPKGPNLPDPELVYEQLLKRKDPFKEHPSGLNRMFFSFATIVIHECFQTSRSNHWINETSSYVDLSTLYGNTEKEQKGVRTYQNGTIFNDSIASDRIMMMPPGVIATLLLFSRNHNSIAENLLTINEEGKYRPWETLTEEQQVWQDEDIFQLSRNINVGFFATVVLKDYVAAILNTPRANSTWSLDLGGEIKTAGQRVDRASGNVVSVEFAVLYHWHAALSAADATWLEDMFKWSLPELKSIDDLTQKDFMTVLMKEGHKLVATPAKEWTFANLQRQADGKFKDSDIAEILKSCVDEPAHAFGAHSTPHALKVVEIMGMLQAREQFRKYLNLKAYKTFEDWNPDKETARAAELLYGHIDNLELYPGLMAEVTKPAMPGSGVCPGQTTGRGILDDAVALIRGDRFLSYDFNSSTLTSWGVSKLGSPPAGCYGGMLPHLIFAGLPGAYTGTSTYALLPFYTPKAARGILKGNGVLDQYDLKRPRSDMDIVAVQSQEACKKVFLDTDSFRLCTYGHYTIFGWDNIQKHNDQTNPLHKIFFEDGFESNVAKFYSANVSKLIKESSLKYQSTKRSIDIVRDVTNVTPILWLAERFAIPLKTPQNPRGLLTLPELFEIYMALYLYHTFNIQPIKEWKLRDDANKSSQILKSIHEAHLKTQQGLKEHLVDWLAKGSAYEVKPEADRIYHALNNTKLNINNLVEDCIGVGTPIAGVVTQQTSLLVDLFLKPEYEQYKQRIIELAHKDDAASDKELQGFVFEGMRLASAIPGVPRVATRDTTVQDGPYGPVNVKKDNVILIATSKANLDPAAFPDPEKLNPHRAVSDYSLKSFGARIVGPSIAATLKEIFKLKNVRRAPGRRGQLHFVEHDVGGVKLKAYLDANSRENHVPTTLSIEYDE
ncbi:hypothetical protein M409DRAFT_24933 [Zasmidium cellare ATCC 36951]|uniref:Linoleate diol synthase n=1 Tax=Zasmidium cellare ATCC 36951 TaxID=1080233 RepID=A0A6A6CF32_ZASCE|nr:uncharacterized protein M409DRAFT_24933 [Zasmidium cellare ATCC 36951]KAF2164532.1 hypothetical protein M409DRAFT_24933 [Zasmidium cellare ATCC 36951]